MKAAGLIIGLLFVASIAPAQSIVDEGKSDYVIVIAAKPQPVVKRAARELNLHLKQMCGVELPIQDDSTEPPAHAIFIGPSRFVEPPGNLGDDGFILKTEGQRLIIAGPGPRGSMYGVSEVLERLGVRWLTPTVTVVPKRTMVVLPAFDAETQVPAFEYREPYFTEAWDKDWAARNRIVGGSPRLDESTGGTIKYAAFVHTFDQLVPPTLYKSHPEYFPLVGGKRLDGYVQRCLTNPDVLKLAIEGVKKAFKEHPEAVITSVSQNDAYKWCECDNCKKLAAQYGNLSGAYLWFVNQVAEAIERDPATKGKLIDTLAYQFTEKPPTGIVPRPNVRVRLCPIAACLGHPMEKDDFPASKTFVANLAGWSKITSTLYIWDYCTDLAHYLQPVPNFDQFPASIRLYHKSGVRGVFMEGAYGAGGGGSDAELRCWVMAKLMWNPNLDSNALVTEWMTGVYGPAEPPMRKWFDLLHAEARKPDNHFVCYQDNTPGYLPTELLDKAMELFNEADKLATGNAIARKYINKQQLDIRYELLMRGPQSKDQIKQFAADCRKLGIAMVGEKKSVDQWETEKLAEAP